MILKARTKNIIKILLTIAIGWLTLYLIPIILVGLILKVGLYIWVLLFIPAIIPILWLKKRKAYVITYFSVLLVLISVSCIQLVKKANEDRVTINVTPNIKVEEYMPFTEDTKIVRFDSKTLKLTENLPVIDGAAAAFPVYSAFVNAVYPETTQLYEGAFQYYNTVNGYIKLAQKETDIFIGAKPSKEQVEYAQECGTEFEYTQIGSEAFVFFVHKDNPVNSLTAEQIKGIYSGEITNWSEVGGKDEKIMAFQRNEGSGSQSMMLRFMGDTPIMEAEKQEVVSGMGGIVDKVADYQNKAGSIGFSFRYYIEGIIQNPDIKIIAVDGVSPSVENIKNDKYPIITPVYAVTYSKNPNENVKKLINWMLSEEGQYIIEETGYAGIKK